MKIYTKTGDTGTTGLFAGPRVMKDHPRIAAYGAVDELNAVLGVLEASMAEVLRTAPIGKAASGPADTLKEIQSDLFSIGAELATPEPQEHDMCLLTNERVRFLEQCIDDMEAALPPLKNFVLPGGTADSASLHWSRTVCRRAEREIVHLSHQEGVHDCSRIVVYLNRLSDLLFVMARFANQIANVPDLPWNRPSETATDD